MPQFANKRRVRHSASEMFDLVADVERYPEFVPLCGALKIRQRTPKPDGKEVVVAKRRVRHVLRSPRLGPRPVHQLGVDHGPQHR